MSLSLCILYEGELDGFKQALDKTIHFKCECGDELKVGGQITERSAVVKQWKERHTGKQHAVVKMAT